jgi:hypothetical protein
MNVTRAGERGILCKKGAVALLFCGIVLYCLVTYLRQARFSGVMSNASPSFYQSISKRSRFNSI